MTERVWRQRTAGGFTLVEVLITLVVLTIGILGLTALQLLGMRSNHSALQRTQAALAVTDLADRMRMAPAVFAGRRLTTAAASGSALFDHWADELGRTLPAPAEGVQGAADCSDGNPCNTGHCELLVRWNDARAAPADAPPARRQQLSSLELRLCTRLPYAA